MDDILDKQDNEPVGGPHPHAGFETVSLLLEGQIGDFMNKMQAGDMQIMTAGSGIVHTETIEDKARMRLLQLWLTLPKAQRWATPRLQNITAGHAPAASAEGVDIKVYSGSFAGISSPVHNYTPLIIADIRLQPGVSTIQQLPAWYNTFLYVLEGSLTVGNESKPVKPNEVAWLDVHTEHTQSELLLSAGEAGARLILYAGEPQGDDIISHGPFIGDTQEDIIRLYHEYRLGNMKHVSTLPEAQMLSW